MTADGDRTRLLALALELRLGALACGTSIFPPARLVEIAETIEDIVRGGDAANANDPGKPYAPGGTGAAVDGGR